MKKLIICAAALATALFAGSCQRELLDTAEGNTVTYTVTVPEAAATKAIGDGKNVDKVVYAVYRVTGESENVAKTTLREDELMYQKEVPVNTENGTAVISLELIKDQDYLVLFWAQVDDAWFNHDNTPDENNTPNYHFGTRGIYYPEDYTPNDDKYAAFSNVDYISVNGSISKKITLTRPFGQLNIATNLPNHEFFTPIITGTNVRVNGAAYCYDVATGKGIAGELEFNATGTISEGFPNYAAYLSMNYVFVPDQKATVSVEYVIETQSHGTVTNIINHVPVQKNYKTNIVGNLLTSKVDYNVELKRDWDGVEEIKIWDGESIEEPKTITIEGNTEPVYAIENGANLAWLAAAVNGTLPADTKATVAADSFAGKTFVLTQDVNLGDAEWTPIGGAKHFEGTFDGQGHVISNMRITKGVKGAGLFKSIAGTVTIKNVTIEKASVVYPGQDDFYGSALVGTAYGNVTIEDVTVKDSYISGNNKVAGILAHDGGVSSLAINNCHVNNCTIETLNKEDGGNVAGLVGLFNSKCTATIMGSSVENSTIRGINPTNNGNRSNGEFVGSIGNSGVLKIEKCKVSGNKFTQNEDVTYVSPYGVFVGGNRNDDRKATVIVDGKHMIDAGFTKKGHNIEVSNASHFLAAANMVEDDDVIKLLGDVKFTETDRTHNSGTWYDGLYYVGDKSFTIDLGGFTVKQDDGAVNDYLLNFKNDGAKANVITLKNGTVDAGTDAFCALCTSGTSTQELTINLEGVNLINNMSNGSTLKIRGAKTTLNVKSDTKITGQDSYLGIECSASTVNIFDGAEIYMNGTTSYNGCLVGVGGNGTVNVYGGYGKGVRGGFIAMTSGGVINVEGGKWIANTDGTVGDNSNLYVLTAQNNKHENGYVGASIINVTGGTFRGGMDAWVLNDANVEKAELNISGGNFNADPDRYRAEGCFVQENENGTYEVYNGTAVSTEDELTAALKAKAAKIYVTANMTISKKWDNRYNGAKTSLPIEIDGLGHTLKFTNIDDAANRGAVFYFTEDALVKNLKIDVSEATYNFMVRAITAAKNLTLQKCTFIGNLNHTRNNAVVVGDCGDSTPMWPYEVTITDCIFKDWRRAISDNENSKSEIQNVNIQNNVFTSAPVNVSAHNNINFCNNVTDSDVRLTSYTNAANTKVKAIGNTLNTSKVNWIGAGTKYFSSANVEAQSEFTVTTLE